MAATFRSPFPMLACDDLARSLAFYELLGFERTYRFPDEGEAEFVALELDGAGIGLGSKSRPPIHGRTFGPRGGHFFELCVYTDDIDTAVAQLRAAGVQVLVEPEEQPWGERIAYVVDPDDNPVMLTQAPAVNRTARSAGDRRSPR